MKRFYSIVMAGFFLVGVAGSAQAGVVRYEGGNRYQGGDVAAAMQAQGARDRQIDSFFRQYGRQNVEDVSCHAADLNIKDLNIKFKVSAIRYDSKHYAVRTTAEGGFYSRSTVAFMDKHLYFDFRNLRLTDRSVNSTIADIHAANVIAELKYRTLAGIYLGNLVLEQVKNTADGIKTRCGLSQAAVSYVTVLPR